MNKRVLTTCLAVLLAPAIAVADWVDARCDIYPKGEDHTDTVIPCVFSQRQGYIGINRADGVFYDLSPQDDDPGHYKDANGKNVYRQSGLGEAGLIFRFNDESVYVYWDTAGLPGDNDYTDFAAPYTTGEFDATTRLNCSLAGYDQKDCAAGINRGPQAGQAVIAIMRPDGVERILQFDGDSIATPDEGTITVKRQSDEWTVSIDDLESYHIPTAAIEGG